MRIVVVCGAGASSTFVAMRIRNAAADRGLTLDAQAASVSQIEQRLGEAEVLLVGPHLADRFAAITQLAEGHPVSPVLMTEEMLTDFDGTLALDAALAAQTSARS